MYKQMKYFIKVVETHSFTKAAEECFISQSAISQQINLLEKDLGVELLKRENRSFTLTPAGEYFYTSCKDIIAEVDKLCIRTKEIAEEQNTIKIGYLRSYVGNELQNCIKQFSTLYPDVNIEIIRGNHEELYDLLKNDEVSFLISDQRRKFHEDYINYHLLYVDCFVGVSKDNSLVNNKLVNVDDLTNMVCYIPASKNQYLIEREFYENIIGVKAKYKFVSDLEDALLLASINKGFFLVDNTFSTNNEDIVLIPLYKNGKHITRNYCAFWKKNNTSYYIEEFVELYRNQLQISYKD